MNIAVVGKYVTYLVAVTSISIVSVQISSILDAKLEFVGPMWPSDKNVDCSVLDFKKKPHFLVGEPAGWPTWQH
jgi:hypothetical protein